jgi:hypothetical protein
LRAPQFLQWVKHRFTYKKTNGLKPRRLMCWKCPQPFQIHSSPFLQSGSSRQVGLLQSRAVPWASPPANHQQSLGGAQQ